MAYNISLEYTGSLSQFNRWLRDSQLDGKDVLYTKSGANLVAAQVDEQPWTWTFTANQPITELQKKKGNGVTEISAIKHH